MGDFIMLVAEKIQKLNPEKNLDTIGRLKRFISGMKGIERQEKISHLLFSEMMLYNKKWECESIFDILLKEYPEITARFNQLSEMNVLELIEEKEKIL